MGGYLISGTVKVCLDTGHFKSFVHNDSLYCPNFWPTNGPTTTVSKSSNVGGCCAVPSRDLISSCQVGRLFGNFEQQNEREGKRNEEKRQRATYLENESESDGELSLTHTNCRRIEWRVNFWMKTLVDGEMLLLFRQLLVVRTTSNSHRDEGRNNRLAYWW